MSKSISKNNELENEMSLDMSYFWYSDVIFSPMNQFSYYSTPTNSSPLPTESVPIIVTRWLPFAAITQHAKRSSKVQVSKDPHPKPPHCTSPMPAQVNTRPTNTPIPIT